MSVENRVDLSNTCIQPGCLAGDVAVITGSTSNVGKGFARALAWAGAKVVVTGRNAARGEAVAAEINEQFGEDTAYFVACDVSKPEDIDVLAEKALEHYGKVDILLNNAMNLGLNGKILETPIEDLDMSYIISAKASMLLMQKFVPGMIERKHGAVSFSTTQFNYMPPMIGGSMYTAGKACATSLTMSLANEVLGTGVNVFCFCPAGVGAINPESVKDLDIDMNMSMPGFEGLIPADAAGAAMVYSILHGEELHGSGIICGDALVQMEYPFPKPETVVKYESPRTDNPMAVTMMFCNMGPGFKK